LKENLHIPLTSAEVGLLWNGYQSETMSLYVFKHFENVVDDPDILKNIQSTIGLYESNIKKITEIFKQEDFPIPVGFQEHDVNLKAPKLFSDATAIYLLKLIVETALQFYSGSLRIAARQDIRDFVNQCLSNYILHVNTITETLLNKGMYVRPPEIPIPDTVDFVKKQSYLTGWLGERRPIHATQIGQIFLNVQRNTMGKTLLIGFMQTVQEDKIRKYFESGKKKVDEFIEDFMMLLKDVDLNVAIPSDLTVTTSTQSPYSDKLILELMLTVNRHAISFYGDALSISTRRDLFTFYSKIINETALYANQNIQLAIELGYLEEQPMAANHDNLSKRVKS